MIVEPWQMHVERALPKPEDVAAFTANYSPHQCPAVAGLAANLLDWHSVLRQCQDGRIGLLSAEIALILEALGSSEQLGIDRSRADGAANLRIDLLERQEL
jgi:hypothetical protein